MIAISHAEVRDMDLRGMATQFTGGKRGAIFSSHYVKDFATGLHENGPGKRIVLTHENHDSETHGNHESRNVIITGPDSWKSFTNNTNNNNAKSS